jgi:hypothetical protein
MFEKQFSLVAGEFFIIGCTWDILHLKLSVLLRGGTRMDWIELKLGCYHDDITDQEV